jgi:CrcB protein
MLKTLLLVGSGGFIGSVLRYLIGLYLTRQTSTTFPTGTFLVNLSGCLIIGIFAGLIDHRQLFSSDVRFFIMIGLLGGFTTFSSYGLETLNLLRSGEHVTALLYVLLSVGGGLLLAALGFWLATLK